MRHVVVAAVTAGVLACATTVHAQGWRGVYVGGLAGGGGQRNDGAERVVFDTNLDGHFTEDVRTVAGGDAFSPGFCGGLAGNAIASSGCTADENGLASLADASVTTGSLAGWVLGGLIDVGTMDVMDHVSAFSTTPAFYAFSREMNMTTGFRGRGGLAGC